MQRDETRSHSPDYLLLRKTQRRPRRGDNGDKNVPATWRQERYSRYRSPRRSRGWSRGRTRHRRCGRARYQGTQHRSFRRSRRGSLRRTRTRRPVTSKRSRLKVKTKRRNSMEGESKNNSPPHDEGYFIILFPLGFNQGHQTTR